MKNRSDRTSKARPARPGWAALLALAGCAFAQEAMRTPPEGAPPAEPVVVRAQEQIIGQVAPTGVRAEISTPQSIFTPDQPIRIRFSLWNTTDQPLSIVLAHGGGASDGLILPLERIVGVGEQRFLTISHQPAGAAEFEPPTEIPGLASPPAPAPATIPDRPNAPDAEPATAAPQTPAPAREPSSLRLAAHAMVGADLDLREFYPHVRYEGAYRLDWRPFGFGGPSASAEFRVEPRKDVILFTDHPRAITFRLDYEGAPLNVQNFLELVRDEFYNGSAFHRVIPGVILQGGKCRDGHTDIRPDGKLIPGEFRNVPVEPGTLLMARRIQPVDDPNSASCQFFVALARQPDWDGRFTVIGRVLDADGLRVLQQLSETATDKKYRPLKPLVIRSVNLVDANLGTARQIEAPRRPTTPTSLPADVTTARRPNAPPEPRPAEPPGTSPQSTAPPPDMQGRLPSGSSLPPTSQPREAGLSQVVSERAADRP